MRNPCSCPYRRDLKISPRLSLPSPAVYQISNLKTTQTQGSGSRICLVLKPVRNDCRICVLSLVFIAFMQAGKFGWFCGLFMLPRGCQWCPINMNPIGTRVIRWSRLVSLYCTAYQCFSTVFLCPKAWEWDARMGWNGLITCAFISSSEVRAKTFNKTFTTVQISISLHPRFPPSGKLQGRPPCPSSLLLLPSPYSL